MASNFGGFSDSRVRFFIFGFMTVGMVMEAFLGIVTALVVVLIFGIFTAVKINEFQEKDPESVLRHWQAMDRLYHGSVNAAYYQHMLELYGIEPKIVKTKIYKSKKMNKQPSLRLAIAR